MQGSFVIFGSLYLLVLLLLFAPIRLRVALATTARGGRGAATAAFLFARIHLTARVHGAGAPALSIELLDATGRTRRVLAASNAGAPARSKWGRAAANALRIRRVEAAFLVGIRHAPAATALLCGALTGVATEALRRLLPGTELAITAQPVFSQNTFRINLEGIACVRIAEIIRERFT